MVEDNSELNWTNRSRIQMKEAYKYISQDSVTSAQKVIDDITNAVEKAIKNPERYALDKYKINNDGTYRAFELHHYRVSYRFKDNSIRVLNVRHTKSKTHNLTNPFPSTSATAATTPANLLAAGLPKKKALR